MCACGTGRDRPRGAALIIAMLIMAVLLLAGTTFMTISSTESQIALNETALNRAFHEAESVLEWTSAVLSGNSAYTGTQGTLQGGGGSFTVSVAPAAGQLCPTGDARTVSVRAAVDVRGGQAIVDLSATVDRVAYPFRFAAFSTVPNTIVTDGRIEQELRFDVNAWTDSFDSSLGAYNANMGGGANNPPPALCPWGSACGNASRFGSAGANGDTYFESGTAIFGDLRAGDSNNNEGNVSVSGYKVANLSPQANSLGEPFPSIAPPVTPTTTLTVGDKSTVTLGGTDAAPVYHYAFTSMSFANNSTLAVNRPVTVYVTGAVTVGTDVVWGNAANPTWLTVVLKSTGSATDFMSLTVGDRFRLHGGLYGKNANIDLAKDSQVFGSVIGRIVRLDDRTVVHYDQALAMQPICRGAGEPYQVRRGTWREVLPSW